MFTTAPLALPPMTCGSRGEEDVVARLVSPSCPVPGQGQTLPMRGHGWSRAPCGKRHSASAMQQLSGLLTPAGTLQAPMLLVKDLGCSPEIKVHIGQLPVLGSALAPHTSPAVVSPALAGDGVAALSLGSPLLLAVM